MHSCGWNTMHKLKVIFRPERLACVLRTSNTPKISFLSKNSSGRNQFEIALDHAKASLKGREPDPYCQLVCFGLLRLGESNSGFKILHRRLVGRSTFLRLIRKFIVPTQIEVTTTPNPIGHIRTGPQRDRLFYILKRLP